MSKWRGCSQAEKESASLRVCTCFCPFPLPDQHWSDSPSDADRELHLRHAAEGAAEPELRVSEDEEKLPASPKHQERGEPVIDGRDNFKNSCKSRVHRRVAQGPGASEQSHGARQPPRCRELLAFSSSVHPPCATGCCRCFGQWPFPCVLWVWEKVEGLPEALRAEPARGGSPHSDLVLTGAPAESAGQPREDASRTLASERTCAFQKNGEQTQRPALHPPLRPLGLADRGALLAHGGASSCKALCSFFSGPSQATSPIRSAQESALLFTPVHSPSTEVRVSGSLWGTEN